MANALDGSKGCGDGQNADLLQGDTERWVRFSCIRWWIRIRGMPNKILIVAFVLQYHRLHTLVCRLLGEGWVQRLPGF